MKAHRLTTLQSALLVCGWLLCYCGDVTAGPSQAATSPAAGFTNASEGLKQWLTSPPIIAEMVAEVRRRNWQSADNETASYYVLLRYQTNAFLYREAPDLLDLASTNVFGGFRLLGHYDSEYWNFSYDGAVLSYATNHDPALEATVQHGMRKASEVLNLGMFGALPGSLVWEGNTIRPFTNYVGQRVEGRLIENPNSPPQALDFTVEWEGQLFPWEVVYEYSPSASRPGYLPGMIAGWSLKQGRVLSYEIRLLSVKVSTDPLPKSFFAPEGFVTPFTHKVVSTPNGKFYLERLNNRLQPVESSTSVIRREKLLRTLFFATCILLTFTVLVISWRRTVANQQSN